MAELADHGPEQKQFRLAVDDEHGYLNPAGRIVKQQAINNGVFLRPLGQVVYLLPPLCLNDAQLEQCYAAIHSGLEAL